MWAREVRRTFFSFLLDGGRITCEVVGNRKYGKGLEVSCLYRFTASRKMVQKVKKTLGKFKTK